MVARAAAHTLSNFIGVHSDKDEVRLLVDQQSFYIGSFVSGQVHVIGYAGVKTVEVVFEGFESTVVAFPRTKDNNMGLDYLKKHTTASRCITRQELSLTCTSSKQEFFKFPIASELPSTMRYRLDGTDPRLPSQCQVHYFITAGIQQSRRMGGQMNVSYPIRLLPQMESKVPVDDSVSVSIGSPVDFLLKSVLAVSDSLCGPVSVAESDQDDAHQSAKPNPRSLQAHKHSISLKSPNELLNLSAGQSLKVKIQDWFGLFADQSCCVWMIQLVEELTWTAKGRRAKTRESWELFANHHEFPTDLRKSYNHDPHSLWQVNHELVVYVKRTKNAEAVANPSNSSRFLSNLYELASTDILASTEPIPVQIVSSTRGWDA